MSKALTGGLLPMAITSCSEKIYNAFLSNEMAKGFFHCHTYSANPIACSAALAVIELLQTQEIKNNIVAIAESHKLFEQKIRQHPKVRRTRTLGVIFAVEINIKMQRYGALREKLLAHFMDNGVFLRPLGNTIYIQPPYVISKKELNKIYNTIESCLDTF